MKSKIMPWIGMLISIAFVILLAVLIDPEEVLAALRQASYWYIFPAIGVSLATFFFRGFRFREMLRPMRFFSMVRAYQYIAINYMANNILPARAGEVMLSYVVRTREQIPLGSSLSVTLFGRIFDGLILLIALSVSLQFISSPGWIRTVLLVGFLVFGTAMLFMVWLIFGKADHWTAMRRWSHGFIPGWLEKAFNIGATQLKQFQRGIMPLRSVQLFALVVLASLVNWVFEGLVFYMVGLSFGIEMSLAQWVFVLAIVNLATAIPSAPAGFGTFHGAVVGSLAAMGGGVGVDTAAAYAIVLHATQVVPVTVVGALSYFRLSLKSVSQAELG